LSILVLLMAIASAFFSYFLFEKRSQLVSGWDKMAVAINRASGELDKNSGTNIADSLTPEKLAHQNYSSLDSSLAKLPEQSRNVIAARDALADALVRIGNSVGMKNTPAVTDITSVEKGAAKKDAVVYAVSDTISKRNASFNNFSNFAKNKLNASVNTAALVRGEASALNGVNSAVDELKKRQNHYEEQFRVIASNRSLNFSGSNYKSSVEKAVNAVRQIRREAAETRQKLSNAERKIADLETRHSLMSSQLGTAQKDLEVANLRIKGYMKALNLSDMRDLPTPWLDGSAEVRNALVGHVIKVDEDYGFIAINIGSESLVEQPIGDKKILVNPKIASGMDMVVARGNLKEDAKFVARIVLDKVGVDCSTANIPLDNAKKINVGDIVYFEGAAK
jgi:hypothetical protein